MKPLVCIVGPTASGKTEVSNLLAKKLEAHVFSIDAFQIYRGMDIGTAKASPEEQLVTHELIDIADVSEPYSAAKFQRVARSAIDSWIRKDNWCVLAGGTGLYLDAVIDEMDFAKGKAGEKRRAEYESASKEELYAQLLANDPESAHMIDKHNKRRLVRALEMLDARTTYAKENQKLHRRKPHYPAKMFSLAWPRELLYERINQRTKHMYEVGLIEETASLIEKGLEESRTAKQAIGYAEALDYLKGNISKSKAIELTAKRTRHYAKRQLSWLERDGRAQKIAMDMMSTEQAVERILSEFSELCA